MNKKFYVNFHRINVLYVFAYKLIFIQNQINVIFWHNDEIIKLYMKLLMKSIKNYVSQQMSLRYVFYKI